MKKLDRLLSAARTIEQKSILLPPFVVDTMEEAEALRDELEERYGDRYSAVIIAGSAELED